jgi:hypothetical protein
MAAEHGSGRHPVAPANDGAAAPPPRDPGTGGVQGKAVELDRVVPPSGNLWIAGQQVWLGPAMTGRTVRIWAGLGRVLLDGHRVKTLPSRLDARDLARLAAAGAQPAGPPLPPAAGDVTEVGTAVTAARTSSRDIRRHRASRYWHPSGPGAVTTAIRQRNVAANAAIQRGIPLP